MQNLYRDFYKHKLQIITSTYEKTRLVHYLINGKNLGICPNMVGNLPQCGLYNGLEKIPHFSTIETFGGQNLSFHMEQQFLLCKIRFVLLGIRAALVLRQRKQGHF
jgi:hypothetical protein